MAVRSCRVRAAASAIAWVAGASLFGCGDDPPSSWGGAQTCSVVIPPLAETEAIAPVVSNVNPLIAASSSGFLLRDFTLGPIGGFACVARQVTVSLVADVTGRVPPPSTEPRAITVEPFDCLAADGRYYTLSGEGAADARGLYFTLTFWAWFELGQGTLVCTTALRREAGAGAGAADAGLPVSE